MLYTVKKGISIDDTVILVDSNISYNSDSHTNNNCCVVECLNEEDLFLKLLYMFPKEPYWKIASLIRKFGIEVTNDYLIKSYCSKCNRLKFYHGEDIYLLINNTNELNKLSLVAICTKYEYINYKDKDSYITIKIKKEALPFYLSLLLKRFTAKDFYFCFKNLTGIKNIPIVNSNSPTFYLVKNKSRVVSYHTSRELAIRTIKLVEEMNPDNINCFNLKIFKVEGYEALLDSIDNFKIQKSSDFEKYMIDFSWYFDYCMSKKYIDISNLELKEDVFLIRNKNGETIIKDNENDMYNYIKDNKLYSEDIFFFENANTDYNSIIKGFELISEEFSHDNILFDYLKTVSYVEKIEILNNLMESVKNTNQNYGICYSLSKSDADEFDLAFFNDEFSFHKHITSLDYGIECLSHGKLNIKRLRNIFNPTIQNKNKNNNKKLSRTDISFNVSNLFKKDNTNCELLKSLKDMDVTLDVDAYLKNNKSACGVVVRDSNNEIITKISRRLDATTSVEAEIKGVIFALDYITRLEPDLKNICLRYDCFSVADYLISAPTSDIGVYYQNFIKNIVKQYPDLNIYIKKVRGHSSDFFNDIADSLAGNFFN